MWKGVDPGLRRTTLAGRIVGIVLVLLLLAFWVVGLVSAWVIELVGAG
jgi:hypothetical protein